MKKIGKKLATAGMALLFAAALSGAVFAYDKDEDKPIRSVGISVMGYIEVGRNVGEEDELEISTSGSKYDYDYYEVVNEGFKWSSDDVPRLKIYLSAAEGYYFHITRASQIRLTGATYVSAARENEAYTLVVEVKLPSLETQVAPILETKMEGGKCTWSESEGAGSYEVKFMRSGTTLGGNQIVTGTSFDGTKYMTKPGDYHFKVRPINKKDTSRTGLWVDSNTVYVSEEDARRQKDANEEEESRGAWEKVGDRWRFKLPDGNYAPEGWRQIHDKWYVFDENGYMRTGWFIDGGNWYYLDKTEGYMWKNTTTPDGYFVNINGALDEKGTASNAFKPN